MSTYVKTRVGPFDLHEELGSGGMATVWSGTHRICDARVAVKVMSGALATDPRGREDFRREVQAAASLNHPGIVRVFDYGITDESASDYFVPGSPYLVMEVAAHGSLETKRPGSWRSIRRIVMQVLDALAYSHARGVIHRDIKPENLLLAATSRGFVRVKLTDFGIAHAMSPEERVEEAEEATGTFRYMPPEQFKGLWRSYGPWTDLYALGCTIWRLATGAAPFTSDAPLALAMQHMADPLPDFVPEFDVPAGLEAWLRRLLEKAPEDRFQHCADAALAFETMSGAIPAPPDAGESAELLEVLGPADDTIRMEGVDTVAETVVLPGLSTASRVESDALQSDEARVLAPSELRSSDAVWGTDDPRPRLPEDWRREDTDYEDVAPGMGLGLFGLREIPFVDRDADRDAIWSALRDVDAGRGSRAVVLRGASGTGKSRIASWMCQRADEVGAAQVIDVAIGEATGTAGALARILDRMFSTWGLDDREKLRDAVEKHLLRLWKDDADGEGFLDSELQGLLAIMRPEPGARASRAERIAAVGRTLRRASARRPVALWLDDLQWDVEAIALARHLVRGNEPVLVVGTVQEEALRASPAAPEALAELVDEPRAEERVLEPLGPADQAELVRRLLGFDPGVARLVAEATAGNPLFAIQLVGDWVERGALRASATGFVLDDDASAPDDLHALWSRRLEHVVRPIGGPLQVVALELAAVLGDQVDSAEWRSACSAASLVPHEELVSALIDVGMAKRTDVGWSFVHALLVESLRRRAREHGRWAKHHHTCGVVIRSSSDPNDPVVAERLAEHFLAARDWSAALDPLTRVIEAGIAANDLRNAAVWLQRRAKALEKLQVGGDDVRRLDQLLMQALIERGSRRGDEGSALLEEVIRLAEPNGWNLQLARALRQKGEDAASAGEIEEASALYDRAFEALEDAEAPLERAAVLESRTWILKSIGRAEEARHDLEAALDLRRAAGDKIGELNVINRLAFTFLAENDYDASREVAQLGIELGRELGHRAAEAGCWTTLGEIERFDGRYDAARECYRRAEELDDLCGNKHVHLVRSNAALVEIGAQRWELALERLDAIEPVMRAIDYGWMLPFLTLGRACCHAGTGDWEAFDHAWIQALRDIEENGIVEIDIAWLAEIAAQAAADNGDLRRAERAQRYAIDVWSELSDASKEREARLELRRMRRDRGCRE